jgi:hypothetical protein
VVSFLSRIHTLYRQYVLGSSIQYVMLKPSLFKKKNTMPIVVDSTQWFSVNMSLFFCSFTELSNGYRKANSYSIELKTRFQRPMNIDCFGDFSFSLWHLTSFIPDVLPLGPQPSCYHLTDIGYVDSHFKMRKGLRLNVANADNSKCSHQGWLLPVCLQSVYRTPILRKECIIAQGLK